ncbi:MAG: sigma-70 family RNA polymerase sigma factor [Myxococcota bacterium]
MDERDIRTQVERARGGDAEAFGALFRGFQEDVDRLCRRLLASKEEAGDAGSEAFLRARRALEAYDLDRPFRPWLLAIVAHHCVDRLRRRSREARLFEPEEAGARVADAGPSPLQGVLQTEQSRRLRAAVEHLPDRYRVPTVLRYFADLDYETIAELLGVSRAQVATLLFRARRRLREGLSEGGTRT